MLTNIFSADKTLSDRYFKMYIRYNDSFYYGYWALTVIFLIVANENG